MNIQDTIYFLPRPVELHFQGGSLIPVDDFETNKQSVMAGVVDGFLYYFNPIPIFRLDKASHILEVTETPLGNFREEDGAFLMHLAAYLYGFRLQFRDWFVDGRLPMQSTHHIFVGEKEAERFFSVAYERWRTWDKTDRRFFTNILYTHSRVPIYYWDWEEFSAEYMVTDSLFKHAKKVLGLLDTGGHRNRIKNMCSHFGVQEDNSSHPQNATMQTCDALIREIVALRNDLLHEALWHDKTPGYGGGTRTPYWHKFLLRGINQRLIAAMLNFQGNYTSSDWRNWQFRQLFA
jgi:hypothetical protein